MPTGTRYLQKKRKRSSAFELNLEFGLKTALAHWQLPQDQELSATAFTMTILLFPIPERPPALTKISMTITHPVSISVHMIRWYCMTLLRELIVANALLPHEPRAINLSLQKNTYNLPAHFVQTHFQCRSRKW